jgi:general secretion pathway protein K
MIASATRDRDSRRDDGFALVLVLWALLLLSVLGASFMLETRTTKLVSNTATSQFAARMLAEGAINRTIVSLLDPRDPLQLPLEGSSREIELLGHRILLRCESEAGKVDLNSASITLLTTLFRGEGLSDDDASFVAQQVDAWRSPFRSQSGDAIVAAYRNAGRRYGPRFGRFRSIGELRLVMGMTDALHAAVAPFITVWSDSGNVDVGVAADGLLRRLAAAGDSTAGSQLTARQGGHAAGADRRAALGEVVTVQAAVELDGVRSTRTGSIQLGGARDEPYRVLAWH